MMERMWCGVECGWGVLWIFMVYWKSFYLSISVALQTLTPYYSLFLLHVWPVIVISISATTTTKEKYTVLVRWDMGLAWLPSWQWDHNWVRRCTYHLLWIVTTHEYIYIYPTTKPWLPSISMSIPCLSMFIHSVPPLTNYLHHPIPALSTGGWQSELQRFLVAWDEDGPPSMAFSTAICAAMGRQQAALQAEIRRCRKR